MRLCAQLSEIDGNAIKRYVLTPFLTPLLHPPRSLFAALVDAAVDCVVVVVHN